MADLILLFIVGIISGIFTGFFGVGGGFFLTPVLNILGLQIVIAIGTVFFSVLGNSLLGAWQHLKQGHVVLKLGILLGLSSIGGVEIGKRFVLYLDKLNLAGTSIRAMYITILVLVSLSMLKECVFQRKKTTGGLVEREIHGKKKNNLLMRWISRTGLSPKTTLPHSELGCVSLWVLVAAGLLIGILSGILGVGGGFISLPFLIYVIGLPAIMAVGTSLIVVFFTSSYGAFTYAISGHVDWTTALVILIGSFLGIQLGVVATKTAAEKRIKVLFALLLLCVAVSVFLKQIDSPNVGIYLVVSGSIILCLIIFWPVGRNFLAKGLNRKKRTLLPNSNPDKTTKR